MELNEILLVIEDLRYKSEQFKSHNLLLLLTLIDLIDNDITTSNRFYYDEDLRRSFSKYLKIYRGPSDKDQSLSAFFHLKNGFPFWHLKPLPGMEKRLNELLTVGCPHELNQVVEYGYLSRRVYDLLTNNRNRQLVKDKIVSVLSSYTESCSTEILPETRSVFLHEAEAIAIMSNSVKRHQLRSCIANLNIFDNETHQQYACEIVYKRTEDSTENVSEQMEDEEEQPSEARAIPFEDSEVPGNPFVAYLNTLHNASELNVNALAESQALSEYFGYIHEPLKATRFIHDELASAKFKHIILTGHAGDGKSTVALELFKLCKSFPLKEPLNKPLRECEELQVGQNSVVLLKDMSELGDSKTLELLQRALSDKGKRYLIVSNTGALLNGFKSLCEKRNENWTNLQNELLRAMEKECPSEVRISDATFLIINLSRINNLTTAMHVFKRMLAPELWQPCETCKYRNACPIDLNVQMLRQNFEIVRERVQLVYRRLFEYGIRLTLRQITGHLAYAITGGLSYEHIQANSVKVPKPPLRHFLFFNKFFGDNGESLDTGGKQLEAICQVRTLEPGQCTLTSLERILWFEDEETPLPVEIDGRVRNFFDFLRKAGVKKSSTDKLPDWLARIQARRILYLFGRFTSEEEEKRCISAFLQSPKLWDFHKWQRTNGKISELERRNLQRAILHVLQEQFTGLRLPEINQNADFIYITLNRNNHAARQSAQIVLGKYSADNFNFLLKRIETPIGDTRFEPVLEESSTRKELRLDLPFLDYVTNRFRGEIAQELQSFFADRLKRFKVELTKQHQNQYSDKMMLVRLKLDHKFKSVNISVTDGKLEVF